MIESILINNLDYAEELLHMVRDEGFQYYIDGDEIVCDNYRCSFSPEFTYIKSQLPKDRENKYLNKLIFGKDSTTHIVNIEVVDDKVILFMSDGTTREEDNRYWIVANKKADKQFERLNGNSHYNYIRYFTDKQEWSKVRFSYQKYDTFSVWDPKESAMTLNGYTLFKGMKPSDLSILSFDIETNGLAKNSKSRVFIISNTFRDKTGKITRKLFSVDNYVDDEAQMIKAWSIWVRKINPEIMVGHNVFSFDLPYLSYILKTRLGEDLLLGVDNSPIKYGKHSSQYRVDGTQSWDYHKADIYGRQIIDTMFLAVKYDAASKNYSSWGLKQIISTEGLEVKGRTFYDASKIKDNWGNLEERKKIKQYAEEDSGDALALFDLMIPAYFYMTQSIPKTLQQIVCSNVGAWINSLLVRSYLQDGYGLAEASDVRNYGGGISFGIPGKYSNALKIDFSSLYPSIIREFKVYDKVKDPCANFFKIVEYFTVERLRDKKIAKETGDKYYNDLQAAKKILVNGSYGMNATPGLLYNSMECAEFITAKARELIKQSIVWATNKDLSHWAPNLHIGEEDES